MMQGAVDGMPKIILRLEGFAVLVVGAFAYSRLPYGLRDYLLYFFLPDVSFIGYLFGPRAGAHVYNFAHSYFAPMVALLIGLSSNQPALLAASFIWLSHIGFDRALGFGLKHSKGFGYTHLGVLGKGRADA